MEVDGPEMCSDVYSEAHSFYINQINHIMIVLSTLNALVNPFIYAFCSTDFKRILSLLFRDLRNIYKNRFAAN